MSEEYLEAPGKVAIIVGSVFAAAFVLTSVLIGYVFVAYITSYMG